MCCYNCGVFGDLKPISDEMKRSFQSIHPICTDCSTQGKKERTRGPKFAGTKRTAILKQILWTFLLYIVLYKYNLCFWKSSFRKSNEEITVHLHAVFFFFFFFFWKSVKFNERGG